MVAGITGIVHGTGPGIKSASSSAAPSPQKAAANQNTALLLREQEMAQKAAALRAMANNENPARGTRFRRIAIAKG